MHCEYKKVVEGTVPLNEAGDSVTKLSLSNKKNSIFIENIETYWIYFAVKQIWKQLRQDYEDTPAIFLVWILFHSKIDDTFINNVKQSGAGVKDEFSPCLLHEITQEPVQVFKTRMDHFE